MKCDGSVASILSDSFRFLGKPDEIVFLFGFWSKHFETKNCPIVTMIFLFDIIEIEQIKRGISSMWFRTCRHLVAVRASKRKRPFMEKSSKLQVLKICNTLCNSTFRISDPQIRKYFVIHLTHISKVFRH